MNVIRIFGFYYTILECDGQGILESGALEGSDLPSFTQFGAPAQFPSLVPPVVPRMPPFFG